MIDYKQLSKNLGLQRNALNLMHSTFNLEKSSAANINNFNNRLLTKQLSTQLSSLGGNLKKTQSQSRFN